MRHPENVTIYRDDRGFYAKGHGQMGQSSPNAQVTWSPGPSEWYFAATSIAGRIWGEDMHRWINQQQLEVALRGRSIDFSVDVVDAVELQHPSDLQRVDISELERLRAFEIAMHSGETSIVALKAQMDKLRGELKEWKSLFAGCDIKEAREELATLISEKNSRGDELRKTRQALRDLRCHIDAVQSECIEPQSGCRDMLGRDVIDGDVMWNVSSKGLFAACVKVGDNHWHVRVPRPGESVPEFEGWQEMCSAMQESGVDFNCLSTLKVWSKSFKCCFSGEAHDYRRSPTCVWKGPQ